MGSRTHSHDGVSHLGDYSNVTECCWCRKPFGDGTAARRTLSSVRLLVKSGGEKMRVHGNVCQICVTKLSNIQVSVREENFARLMPSQNIPPERG